MADRLTQPAPWDGGLTYGGIGVVPRRQQDPILSGIADAALRLQLPGLAGIGGGYNGMLGGYLGDARFAGLAYAAQTMPLRLLRILLAQDGTAQMASSIETALAFGAGKVRFVAVKDWRNGKGVIDDDMTAEVARVHALYEGSESRSTIGSGGVATARGAVSGSVITSSSIPAALPMLMHAADRINDTGQVLFEAVGDVGVGVTAVYDFDALTCRYRDAESNAQDGRHTTTGGVRKKTFRVFEQQQTGAKADPRTGAVDGWRLLSGPSIASVCWKGSTGNPYGYPRNGAALAYLLRKIARRRDLGDWLHNVAWPKIIVEQAIQALVTLATEHPELGQGKGEPDEDGVRGDLEPTEWAAQQQKSMREMLNKLVADDIWMIGEGKAYVINPSDIGGLVDVLKMDRIEEIQSLNMLPSLVGVTDGGTQAYAEVQWLAETQGLALMSAYSSAGPVQIGNYHLRLLGEDMIVRAEFDDLPPIDPQKQAIARQVTVNIEEHLAAIGVNSAEDFSLRVSGGGAADAATLAKYLSALASAVAQLPTNPPAA